MISAGDGSGYELTKYALYLTLTDKLWSVFCE